MFAGCVWLCSTVYLFVFSGRDDTKQQRSLTVCVPSALMPGLIMFLYCIGDTYLTEGKVTH